MHQDDSMDETHPRPVVPQFAVKLKAAVDREPADCPSEDEPVSPADRRAATSLAALAGVLAVAAAFVFARQANGPAPAAAAGGEPAVVETVEIAAVPLDMGTPEKPGKVLSESVAKPMMAPSPKPFEVPTVTSVPMPGEEPGFDKNGEWDEVYDRMGTAPVRRVGLNYFVLRSTPDLAEAERRLEKALAAGVQCHIEPALPGFTRKGWWSLVTTQGFSLPDDRAAYGRERDRLRRLGFEPAGYCWR